MNSSIRVLIAEDHPLVSQALSQMFAESPDIVVIGQAEDGQAAVELTVELRPDVVLMDHNMPGLNGVEATRRIRATCPDVRVIGVSMHADQVAQEMRTAGATACLTKGDDIIELAEIVRGAAQADHSGAPV
jgi:DNA-binding NarL/FixJ family response regulator